MLTDLENSAATNKKDKSRQNEVEPPPCMAEQEGKYLFLSVNRVLPNVDGLHVVSVDR